MGASRREFLLGAAAVAASAPLSSLARAASLNASPFLLESGGGVLTSLRFAGDAFPTNYVASGQALGHIDISWRNGSGAWQQLQTSEKGIEAKVLPAEGGGTAAEYRAKGESGDALRVTSRLEPQGQLLQWTITLENLGSQPLEIGDLAVPLPMHSSFAAKEPPTASVLKHHFISGDGSYLFWMRKNSVGPYLVMTPEHGTHLEYWDHTPAHRRPEQGSQQTPAPADGRAQRPVFRAYMHSVAAAEEIAQRGGRWRQPHTGETLPPAGAKGSVRTYAFQLAWASDYAGVRERIVDAGLPDVEVAPGMTVPSDLSTCVAIRSKDGVQALEAEHPERTKIEPLGERNGRQLYRVSFAALGENMLTVRQRDGRETRLEFFACEPVETLLHKRAAFIARHQVRDASKWYDGLLCEWAMDTHVQLGPENYDRIKGWRVYEVTCDDPGLSKPAFLASKNAEFPDPAQVEALDHYIDRFVWGGLQRTTDEKYSYGIYGILDWKQNRDSSDPGPKGKLHIWRPYDYSHIVVMYFSMYKIARGYPGITMKLDKSVYLERAYGTALAMFTVPMEVTQWSAYETGFYNELVIPQLIDELDENGRHDEAAALRAHWEKKVAFFISGQPDLFGSEYAFDSTGFESTQAIARYALAHPQTPGITAEATKKFALTQMQANLFCRGVVEKAYYYYGSDYRGGAGDSFTLTYMSQLGGWAVLDHALYERRVPDATVRLGYASYLSAFALMNTGTAETGYGYWFPGEESDGGSGGGFEPAAYGMTWLGQPHHRGPWYYSSESDLGYCGAVRTAATIVADDPVFGLFCFGGEMRDRGSSLEIVPRDGLRRRLHLRTSSQQIDLEIGGARFAKERPITSSKGKMRFLFHVETDPNATGEMTLRIAGLPAGNYRVRCGGQSIELSPETGIARFQVPASSEQAEVEILSA
ncbi:DUF5695 domain-containing protein [Silvibacterium sp.]|uniref:DUF5695 domain-containing protein n=1 Tax=Silvibacterium sp. TaxID=1964179 RepID=UPI0039E3B5E6